MMEILFGADPEVFSVNAKGEVISPCIFEIDNRITPIIKDKKHPVYIMGEEFTWMMDGAAWEITFLKPFKSFIEIHRTWALGLNALENFVKTKIGGDIDICVKPAVKYNSKYYKELFNSLSSDEDKEKLYQGTIFGCDPDLDAIERKYYCTTQEIRGKYRYGGGHIHVSTDDNFLAENPIPAVRFLAITVGNFCFGNSLFPELERIRLGVYGRPGRYRIQRYKNNFSGVEYRSPSNSWMVRDEKFFYELEYWVRKGISFLYKKKTSILDKFLPPTIEAISNVDQNLCLNILDEVKKW